MSHNLENLRPLCGALMATSFEFSDRLKAILQTAYEILGADSIVAYQYDRISEQLQILAMPGVQHREMMRGPTPEPIFTWHDVTPPESSTVLWLENQEDYERYLTPLRSPISPSAVPRGADDFRRRQLRKYGSQGDLALAKICLYKGVGQTYDRVGQLFFNFHKPDPSHQTFTDNLKSAILYVSTVIRELLINELYHKPFHRTTDAEAAVSSLHLLRAIDDRLKPALTRGFGSICELHNELRKQLVLEIEDRERALDHQRNSYSESARHAQKAALASMRSLLDEVERSAARPTDHEEMRVASRYANDLLRDLLGSALSRELWRLVCHSALSIVETYGGQADIILIMGERLGKRILPGRHSYEPADSLVWLHPETITGYCIKTGKMFTSNNVPEKASEPFPAYFQNEPHVEHYKSLMIVPVAVEGEIRALLRLMSTDENCFLDKHSQAMQDLAFVTSYALHLLDARQRREGVVESLSFFARSQAVAERPSFETMLRSALRVFGADLAIFWPLDTADTPDERSPQGVLVRASDEQKPQYITREDGDYGIRSDGITYQIWQCSKDCTDDLLFCIHVLRPLACGDGGRFPEYVLQVYTPSKLPGEAEPHETPDGFCRYDFDSTAVFPGSRRVLSLSDKTIQKRVHSQIGFAVRGPAGSRFRGVVWMSFSELHYLGWWERLYVRGLANYLGQSLLASDLDLAIRSFRHMIPDITYRAAEALSQSRWGESGYQSHVEALPQPDDERRAIEKAYNVLYMTYAKASEVQALLTGKGQPVTVNPLATISEILRRSWAIASNLKAQEADFAIREGNPLIEECLSSGFVVVYDASVRPDTPVGGAVYTAAVNILSNATRWGSAPFVVWASCAGGILTIVLANGGLPPDPNPLLLPETAEYHSKDGRRGVGLALIRRIFPDKSRISMLNETEFWSAFPQAPGMLRQCRTFFEVCVPI